MNARTKEILALLVLPFAACSPVSEDNVNAARTKFENELKGKGIYERGNLPEDIDVEEDLNGYFDIVNGAYRYIVNEDRADRNELPPIEEGDLVELYFDARVYGSSFENSTTFYTNIASRRSELSGANPEFDPEFWPTDPLSVEIPNGSGILKSIQRALVDCRVGDVVRIYLTPDIAFGSRAVYNVPAGSSLVFEVTDIRIMN